MAAPGPSATDLAATNARDSQLSARLRAVREADTLLVVDHISDQAENLVKTVSSTALKSEILSKLITGCYREQSGPNALSWLKTLASSRNVSTHWACWPICCRGKLPWLIIWLHGATAPRVGTLWCPSSTSSGQNAARDWAPPNVFDLDLASASETKFKEAVKWLSRKQAETREAYGFFIPAADVEAVQILEMCRISSPCSPIVFHPFSIYTIYSFPLYYILWGRVQLGSVKWRAPTGRTNRSTVNW